MSKLKKGPMLQYINQIALESTISKLDLYLHRIFLSRIMTDNGRKANPNAKINTILSPNPKDKPNINITFRDGKTMDFDASTMKINELLRPVEKHIRKLREQEDIG
ncbi:8615_t:CDS:2 [Paraglomus brasilianum]|uniref:Large ribosomal subunit protein mL53 n=1 Tax=Paraglomus brasilianum TaxID=144538 RepID=A0A9N9FY67_9GLOM|nr:8615_t:CDS:2 [Paraglomus brasilianum]